MQNLENQIGSLYSIAGSSPSFGKISVVFSSQMLPNAAVCFEIRDEMMAHASSVFQVEIWGPDGQPITPK